MGGTVTIDTPARAFAPAAGRGVLPVALAAVLLLMAASLAWGARSVGIGEVWAALWSHDGSSAAIIVREMRVPRTLLAVAVGAALGTAGALLQGHTRNPLADPGLLGVSAGAAFAVVLGLHLELLTSMASYLWSAFVGALVASAVVFGLGSVGRGGPTPAALAMAGAAVTAFLAALTSALVLLDVATLDAFRFWAVGSVGGADAATVQVVGPVLCLGLLLAVRHARALDTLSLGVEVARALGQRVALVRVAGVVVVALLAGAAVAAAGPIAFVGLLVPHAARILVGPGHRRLVPLSAALGAALLLAADVVGRLVVRPGELQVGVVLALIGAPVFIALVRRARLAAL
jgi:iron complex transport system permease protein